MMIDPLRELVLYLRLAQACKDRLLMPDRDRALVLAGVCATILQMPAVGNFCRQLVLQNNPGHMLRRYETFLSALEDPDVGVFINQLRRKLPVEKAEARLVELSYACDVKQTDYADEQAYVAAVMGIDLQWLREHFES